MSPVERAEVDSWFLAERALGNRSAANRVQAALISGEELIHPEGILWLLAQMRRAGTASTCALLVFNELRANGQIERVAA